MNLCVIPARAGSKRVPNKNVREFGGRPILSYPIEAAKASGLFDAIAVSSEDQDIRTLAYDMGATLLLQRPVELADDHATTADVMEHAVGMVEREMNVALDVVCCLYAPTPFVEADDLRSGFAALDEPTKHYALSVTEFDAPIWRALDIGRAGNGFIERPFFPEKAEVRTQDLLKTYRDAGQWYFGRAGAWKNRVPIYGQWSVGVRIPRARAIDIDTPEDWAFAEQLWRGRKA